MWWQPSVREGLRPLLLTRRAINLVSDNRWQRAAWWIIVSPRLIYFSVAMALGFYRETPDED
jgi:hypothetical protein